MRGGKETVLRERSHEARVNRDLVARVPEGVSLKNAAVMSGVGLTALRGPDDVLKIRRGGRLAFPTGIMPEPKPPAGVKAKSFDGDPNADILRRLERLMRPPSPLRVHIDAVFALNRVAAAHRALGRHHVVKLPLRIA